MCVQAECRHRICKDATFLEASPPSGSNLLYFSDKWSLGGTTKPAALLPRPRSAQAAANSVPIYRYYASWSGDHFYTKSQTTPGGYVSEGIEFYAYQAAW